MMQDTNPNTLILDPKHPGIHDAHYLARRQYFFDLGREYRLHKQTIPLVQYESREDAIWAFVCTELEVAHRKKACQLYLDGKEKLGLSPTHMPQLYDLDQMLRKDYSIGIAPAEGLLDTRTFFYYLSKRLMPCTQFIRHHSNPEYTPEPDAVHDVLGHVPALMNEDFNDIIELIGQGVLKSTDEDQLQAWARIYWFSIEFGLLQEENELKVLGAGILSSFGEMDYCFSNQVQHFPFKVQQVIQTAYDPTCMQNTLFIISSLKDLKDQLMSFYQHTAVP